MVKLIKIEGQNKFGCNVQDEILGTVLSQNNIVIFNEKGGFHKCTGEGWCKDRCEFKNGVSKKTLQILEQY